VNLVDLIRDLNSVEFVVTGWCTGHVWYQALNRPFAQGITNKHLAGAEYDHLSNKNAGNAPFVGLSPFPSSRDGNNKGDI
jgi:hypothetical protein